MLLTASWSWALLDRTPQWESWMRVLIPASAAIAVVGLLAAPALRRFGRRASIATAVLRGGRLPGGPVAYSAQTIATAHTGSIPSAGPGSSVGAGAPGGAPGRAGGSPPGDSGGSRPAWLARRGGCREAASTVALVAGPGRRSAAVRAAVVTSALVRQTQVSAALKQALESDADQFRWVAAVSGSQTAASLELATGGEPVMAIGGFNNQGGRLTLAQFEQYVGHGDIHYYFASDGAGAGPGGGMGSSSTAITSWVEAHFKSVKLGGQTVYDLTQART